MEYHSYPRHKESCRTLDPQVVRVAGNTALLTFRYDLDDPIEYRYNMNEGVLQHDLTNMSPSGPQNCTAFSQRCMNWSTCDWCGSLTKVGL